VAKKHAASPFAPEALYRSAKLYPGPETVLQSVREFLPGSLAVTQTTRASTRLSGNAIGIASALLDGARNRIWGVIPGFQNRTRAISYFELIVRDAPYSDYAPLALMNKARGHLRSARSRKQSIPSTT
jgi:outer membrane protein assembly factor BamD